MIGTLLGTRTETDVEVHNCFAVLHSESDEQVAVDNDYHRAMFELHHKVHPKEVIVGWYAHIHDSEQVLWRVLIMHVHRYSTGSNLNTYSALIQNFYSDETAPHPAIHLVLDTGSEDGVEPGVKAYLG